MFDCLSEKEICDICRQSPTPELAAGDLSKAVRDRALQHSEISEEEYARLPVEARRDIHDDVTVAVFFLKLPAAWRKQFRKLSDELQRLCDSVIAECRKEGGKKRRGGGRQGGGWFGGAAEQSSIDAMQFSVYVLGWKKTDCGDLDKDFLRVPYGRRPFILLGVHCGSAMHT